MFILSFVIILISRLYNCGEVLSQKTLTRVNFYSRVNFCRMKIDLPINSLSNGHKWCVVGLMVTSKKLSNVLAAWSPRPLQCHMINASYLKYRCMYTLMVVYSLFDTKQDMFGCQSKILPSVHITYNNVYTYLQM